MSKLGFVEAWIKAKKETDNKLMEKRIEDKKKAEYWAEQRKKQAEEEREREFRLFNPTPEEKAAREASRDAWLKELHEETDRVLLERLGSMEAVAEHRARVQKEFAEFREIKKREREQARKEREEWERSIGARK